MKFAPVSPASAAHPVPWAARPGPWPVRAGPWPARAGRAARRGYPAGRRVAGSVQRPGALALAWMGKLVGGRNSACQLYPHASGCR